MTSSCRQAMRLTALLGLAMLQWPGAAAARDIHYGAVTQPDLLACDRLQWRGRLGEADGCYRGILGTTLPAAIRAEAAWALDDLKLANRLFRQATAESPDDAGILVRWGDLFADSHQDSEAMNIYREALELDPGNAFAMLGAARVLVGGFDDAANAYLEPLLKDDDHAAGARAAAWLLVARVSMENSQLRQASDALDKAGDILLATDWPPLELYAEHAALDLLNNVTDSRFTGLALDYNPAWGSIYAIPAHFYVITRRYREAIDLYQKAVDVEPRLASAHEELGVNLLRDNQVSRARQQLERAYKEDPFSPIAVNTLRLLDSFDNFEVVSDPKVPRDGVLPVVFRLHKDEAAAILPYAIDLARASIEEYTRRYAFELREPVVVEMYPDAEDFAVRTAGMPGIGLLGATFGYVVAMDSPSARPPEEFQWGTTLWHEMAHVFTLEATGHLVPRWFSEGISVYEEWRSGPNPGVHIPMGVYAAMKDDRFLPVAELDEGFVRPTYEQQVIVSYMQAGLVCQYIDETYGTQKLRAMLDAFGAGKDTAAAIESVLGIPSTSFDDQFDAFVRREHGTALDNLDEWAHGQETITGLIDDEDWDAIVPLATRLTALVPYYVEADSPYLALARAEEERGGRDAAVEALERFWENGGYDPGALKRLAAWYVDAGQGDDAIRVLGTVNLVDPLDTDLHERLGDLLLASGQAEEALREFEVLLALDPHDKAAAWYRLASANHALGNRDTAQAQLLQALDIAPGYRPAQRLLLDLTRGDEHTDNN